MGTELATYRKTGPPAADPRVNHILPIYRNRLEVHPGSLISISDRNAPTLADARLLRDRRGVLADVLMPAAVEQVAIRVGEMFFSFPSVKMDAPTAKKTTAAYVAKLQHLPFWAIECGCCECEKRDCPFPPSAGELLSACERAVDPAWKEAADLRKILEAQIYHEPTEGERARIQAGFDKLLADLQWNKPFEGRRQRRPDARDPKPAEPVPDTEPLPMLSAEALEMLKSKAPRSFVEGE